MKRRNRSDAEPQRDYVAAGGLLGRRAFLFAGVASAGFSTLATVSARGEASRAMPPATPPWMKIPGGPPRPYGSPSLHEAHARRGVLLPYGELAAGSGVSMTPLHVLEGAITPNGLHFERHHNGIPDIDPEQHRLLIHGLVKRPLVFSLDALLRYAMTSRICFIECSGNSFLNTQPEAPQLSCGMIHGLVSCSEWTGVPLGALLDEAGLDPRGKWLLVEGADAAAMSRSVPLELAMSSGLVALYQNGERIRPEQGYPMRLLLPGLEGNLCVKWLRRIKVTAGPTYTRDETSKYTELMLDGKARQFTLPMGVKSVITRPATGMTMQGAGFYEITGLAWSGAGRIARVEVSADGGASWAAAALQDPILPQCLTRFRVPWQWNGGPALLQSRATDERGDRQTTRAAWAARRAPGLQSHYNAIQTWKVKPDGTIENVYV